ncbi:MAG: glycosyltransferase family 2 protein [Bacteroidetes bacterium]|nr:MAG: glycosyltransferase family 2 protein [Bacteroidota bacterium]
MNHYNPKVSILIPLYNSEKYISETINSCLKQIYKNIEIIIVDDGSQDNSYEIARKFENKNVIVVKQQNKGASAARNKAFEISTGNYIQYLDADDLLSEDKIEDQIEIFKENGESIVTACSWGDFYGDIEKTKFNKTELWQNLKPVEWLEIAWKNRYMMQPACFLTPRKIIEKSGGWDESLTLNDDGEFFCRVILQSSKVVFTEGKVFYRRNVENNLSSRSSYKDAKSQLDSCISYQNNIFKVERTERIKSALANNYINFIYIFYRYPDLVKIAKSKLSDLGYRKIPVVLGGEKFKKTAKILGFENTLKLRKLITGK